MDEEAEQTLRAELEAFDGAPNTPETCAGIAAILVRYLPPVVISDHIEFDVKIGVETHEVTISFESKSELGNRLLYGMQEAVDQIPTAFNCVIPIIPSLWPGIDRRRLKRAANRERKARQRAAKRGNRHA